MKQENNTHISDGNVYVKTIADPMFVVEHWDFFHTGLDAMKKVMPTVEIFTREQYSKILIWCAANQPKGVIFGLFREGTDELIGYGGCYMTQAPYSDDKNLHIFAAYSEAGKTAETRLLFESCKNFAREHGYKTVSGFGGRLNGFKRRFWQETLGFKLSFIGFIYHVEE